MITLDTNVLLRILVDDPDNKVQNEIARNFAVKYKQFYIPQVVQVELTWVLIKSYKLSKEIVEKVLNEILENKAFKLEFQNVFEKALEIYRHNNIDFSDCIIYQSSLSNKIKQVLTFDKKFSNITGVILVK